MAKYPNLVMIIRHGEKPGDLSSDKDGGPNLSIQGSARAAALPSLFTPDPAATPVSNMQQVDCDVTAGGGSQFTGGYGKTQVSAGNPRFPIPNFLFATAQTDPPTGSNRPVETITPLSQALKIAINNHYGNTDGKHGIEGLVSEIGTNSIYAGQVVLICWHHGTIPKLVEAFGVPKSQLPWHKWPGTIFDLVLSITWDGDKANLAAPGYQQLLYGDATSGASATA